ncbi:MAG: IMP dehydrogenase [Kiritimatiellia bacterium]
MNDYLKRFMEQFPFEGLTYDDVTLVTQYADFLPDETSLATRLTSRQTMNIPFMSAAMDTVTEAPMAIAMALAGGIGVIHKNLTEDEQAAQVARVKHYLNGLIAKPVCFHANDDIKFLLSEKKRRNLKFGGFPILDDQDRLVGMLAGSDIRYSAEKVNEKLADVMTRTAITGKPGTTLEEAYKLMREHKIGKLPLVDKEGHLAGLYSFTDVQQLIENTNPSYNRDNKHRLRVSASVSGGAGDYQRMERLAQEEVDVIVVDSAHGHSRGIIEMVKWIAKSYPEIDIIAGNIATGEAAIALRDAGAHAVKVGIGPGSICTTRVVCGVGIPQLTAIYNASSALKGSIPVIGDGGIKLSGDVPKALLAGADCLMLGSVLAGTEESPGEKILNGGRQYVVYRGMGSLAALKNGKGSRARYFQDNEAEDDLVPQGIEGMVPYSGPVHRIMTQFCGGLKSSLGYCGCKTIAELQERGKFYRVTANGVREAHPHDVMITKEAPNYRT